MKQFVIIVDIFVRYNDKYIRIVYYDTKHIHDSIPLKGRSNYAVAHLYVLWLIANNICICIRIAWQGTLDIVKK